MANPQNPTSPDSNAPETGTETGGQPEAQTTAPESLHEQPPRNQTDLAEFNKDFLERQKDRAAILREFEGLDSSKPADVTHLRRGGVEQTDDEKDTLKKHTRLASAFLEKADENDKTGYMVDFRKNEAAEKNVGAGDILPANVEAIKVLDDNGNVVCERAVRNINRQNRIGYYDAATGAYIAVHTGYRIIVLATRTDTSRRLTEKDESSFRADRLLARRKMSEHVSLYSAAQNTAPEDVQVGLNNQTPATATADEIQRHELPPSTNPAGPAQREVVATPSLQSMGYRRLSQVTPGVTQEAVRCLKKGGPIGTTHFAEIDGKKYAFHREMHKHAPSECPPLPANLCAPHHGISVFAA